MDNRVRLGIVGTSGYSEMVYLSGLSAHEEVELVALCGRNRARTEAIASKYDIPEVYTDYREMIKRGKLDGIILAAPDDLHHPMAMAALQAGLHVLGEKPMALNVHQAEEMLEAAERAGVKHMIEFSFRWMPHYRYLHQLVSEGYIGRPYHYYVHFFGDRALGQDYEWRWDPTHSLGVLGDSASHAMDMVMWLGGDITGITANLASFNERVTPEGQSFVSANESTVLILDLAQGGQGILHLSQMVHMGDSWREQHVTLNGEAGKLELEWKVEAANPVVIRGVRQGEKEYQTLEVPDHYLQGVAPDNFFGVFAVQLAGARLFVDAILRDYMPTPNFHDGLKVQRLLDAALQSHATGKRVSLQP
jgi:predicted dehydrogenase